MTALEGVVLITESEVRASVRRVVDHAESIWDEWAWQVENKTWNVIGYSSWDEMRRAEYGSLTSITAPREERPELVARFRGAGLTQQQTATTLGVSQGTVSHYEGSRPSPKSNINFDTGEVSDDYVTDQADLDAPFVDASDDQIEQAFAAAREQSDVSHRNVVGNLPDGKTYTRPEPSKPKARPITDQFFDAAYELTKVTERIERLVKSDRFAQNAEKVAARNRADLIRARDLLEQVINQLPSA